jgi:hypothetical protein
MTDPTALKWIITLVLTVTAFWFVFRATGPGKAAPGAGERITHVAHVAMAAAMIAMMWLADPMGM